MIYSSIVISQLDYVLHTKIDAMEIVTCEEHNSHVLSNMSARYVMMIEMSVNTRSALIDATLNRVTLSDV